MAETQEYCPYLAPVTADRMWVFPVSAYCHRPMRAFTCPASRNSCASA